MSDDTVPGACEYCGAMDNYLERERLRAELASIRSAWPNTIASFRGDIAHLQARCDKAEDERDEALADGEERAVEQIAEWLTRSDFSVPYPDLCRRIARAICTGKWKP